MPSLKLIPVDAHNVREVCQLDAGEHGVHVSSPATSIAESKFKPHWIPYAVYDDELVGFALLGPNDPRRPEEQWIVRLMIDGRHQGKGYGTALTQAAIDTLEADPDVDRIRLSIVPTNTGARRLYERFGFEDTGETDVYGDLIFERTVFRQHKTG